MTLIRIYPKNAGSGCVALAAEIIYIVKKRENVAREAGGHACWKLLYVSCTAVQAIKMIFSAKTVSPVVHSSSPVQ